MVTPAIGQNFWMINSRFHVIETKNSGSNKSTERIAAGNWFRSKSEAEAFRDYVLKGTTQIIPPVHIPVQYADKPQIVPVRVKKHVYDLDTMGRAFSNNILGLALSHNANVIEYATQLIVAGPVDGMRGIKRMRAGFKNIHEKYLKDVRAEVSAFSKEIGE